MQSELIVSDYTYYLVENPNGEFRFKEMICNIFRRPNAEFETYAKNLSSDDQASMIVIYGITSVERIETGEHLLVFECFMDLRDQSIVKPVSRQAILVKSLLEENQLLRKILEKHNISIKEESNDSSRD